MASRGLSGSTVKTSQVLYTAVTQVTSQGSQKSIFSYKNKLNQPRHERVPECDNDLKFTYSQVQDTTI